MKDKNTIFLYKLGLILFIVLLPLYILLNCFELKYRLFLFPCLFHKLTKLYCPGCGGTRAVMSLLNGNMIASIKYNPIVVYGTCLYAWFMLSNTVSFITRGKFKIGMKYSDKYIWLGLALMIISCIAKNIILIVFKTAPIA